MSPRYILEKAAGRFVLLRSGAHLKPLRTASRGYRLAPILSRRRRASFLAAHRRLDSSGAMRIGCVK